MKDFRLAFWNKIKQGQKVTPYQGVNIGRGIILESRRLFAEAEFAKHSAFCERCGSTDLRRYRTQDISKLKVVCGNCKHETK